MKSTYNVIYASAGSGKTYALVSEILAICLKYPSPPDTIKHILALTFTNKAANEMKQRILTWLKDFTNDHFQDNHVLKNIQNILKLQGINVSLDDLHLRSKKVLDHILHHYSILNISTIDKFNSRLIHQFSYELGLAKNFNLEINPEPFLIEAVDKMLDNIGEDAIISDAFMDLIVYNLDQNERISLSESLYQSAKEFVKDKHYFEIQKNKDFSWEAYEKEKLALRTKIKDLEQESQDLAQAAKKLISSQNLEISDFSGGKSTSIAIFFDKFLAAGEPSFPKTEDGAIATFEKLTAATKEAKSKSGIIEEILPSLLSYRATIINNHVQIKKSKAILKALLPLKINKDIQDQLEQIELENDLVLLSKFNVMIHENLAHEPSSFIYEKVGTQFNHYFFDEFQDTSKLQWQNFIPLRDHTINSENLSFNLVGDPKQSIYRFRGGDSNIMLNIINKTEKSPIDAHQEELKNNWRSAKNIVDFNNNLYLSINQYLEAKDQHIFGEAAVQIPQSQNEGRVKINLIENAKQDQYYEDVTIKMQQDIQECIDHGYLLSDITILCRGNTEISRFSQLLGNLSVNYKGNLAYIKTISEKGLTLELSNTLLAVISYLNWQQNPRNTQYLAKMLYHLSKSGRILISDFSAETLTILNLKTQTTIESYLEAHYQLKLNLKDQPKLNLYNFVENYVQEFAVEGKETDYLLNFLELIYNFSQNTGFTVKDLIKFWNEEGRKTSIQTSENIDAIKIMTIHKAKGLEFPIVFLPMENKAPRQSPTGWLDLDNPNLQTVNLANFNNKLQNYFDEDMSQFNQENNRDQLIDKLCVQYVATTRAVDQMFFYLQKANKTSNHLEILDYAERLHTQTKSQEDSFDVYPISKEILTKKKEKEQAVTSTRSIKSIHQKIENKKNIIIATPSKNYQQRNASVRAGIFTHEILSKVKSEKDIARVLTSYALEGIITNTEKTELEKQLISFVHNPSYAAYFAEDLDIINERDLMISEDGKSKIYRPDRLINTKDGYIIIDFKTGEKNNKHQDQINNYKTALEKLGHKVWKTELIYL